MFRKLHLQMQHTMVTRPATPITVPQTYNIMSLTWLRWWGFGGAIVVEVVDMVLGGVGVVVVLDGTVVCEAVVDVDKVVDCAVVVVDVIVAVVDGRSGDVVAADDVLGLAPVVVAIGCCCCCCCFCCCDWW